ncbi:hypothetical protein [Metabacillus bambusae]|uniref:DUF3168 domain-containing protein n=1 Tax=Metabacillus bambusae TaxID=2795218 RepID=A0ABS3N539_9BACI|nr:hypothetical protein [Metabacillus bambusae]MBO1513260.1 hypothetical protein [Metabacillus bambusae]
MIWKINDALKVDPIIIEKVGNRIKFYEYPSTGDLSGPYIIIDPLDTPIPSDYADNKWLTEDYLYQIEVWSKTLSDTQAIAKQIRKIMWDTLGFANYGGGVDEWDKDLNIFRDARRYRGKAYVDAE